MRPQRALFRLILACLLYALSISSLAFGQDEDYSDCMKCHKKTLEKYAAASNKHDPFAEEECDACHDEKHKKMVEEGVEVCYQCHDTFTEKDFVHGPVSAGKCTLCHNPHASNNKKMLIAPKKDLCGKCHDLKKSEHGHKPVEKKQCEKCHDPHGSDYKSLLVKSPMELCVSCHAVKEKEYSHGPYAAGACLACHTPHGSANPKLLVAQGKGLCLICHSVIEEKLELPSVHGAIEKKGCNGCHDPHTSDFRFQLKKKPNDLCVSCHDKIEQIAKNAKVKHDPVTKGRACGNCHDPHGSNFNPLLVDSEKNLCLSCHNVVIKMKNGDKLTNMASLLKKSEDHHGPIREELCVPCHNPHGGPQFRLLKKKYPTKFYARFNAKNYELCFTCHNEQIVETENTTTLTNFRNGSQNLHYLHVNQRKGRTCRACHEVHASHWPKHIRKEVPFGKGNWSLPLNFKKIDSGGSCTPGCHRKYSYDREKPVANRKK